MKWVNINTIKGFLFWVLILPFIISLIIKSIDYNLEKNEFEFQFKKLKNTYDYSFTFEKPKYDNQFIKELISDEEYQYECNKKNGIYTNFNHSSFLSLSEENLERIKKIKQGYFGEYEYLNQVTKVFFFENQIISKRYFSPKCKLKTKKFNIKFDIEYYLSENQRYSLDYYEKIYLNTLLNDIVKIQNLKKTIPFSFYKKIKEFNDGIFKINSNPLLKLTNEKIIYDEFDFDYLIEEEIYNVIFNQKLFLKQFFLWFSLISFLPFIIFLSNNFKNKKRIILINLVTIIYCGFFLADTNIPFFNKNESQNCPHHDCYSKLEHWPIVNYYHKYEKESTFENETSSGWIYIKRNYEDDFSGLFHKYTYDDFLILYLSILLISIAIYFFEKKRE
jgi:hypothetical protein